MVKKKEPKPKAKKTNDNVTKKPEMLVNKGRGGAVQLFPTVCYIKPHTGLGAMNTALEAFVDNQEKRSKGLEKSSIKGGYHSNRRFFENDNQAVQQLKQLIHQESSEYLKEFWKTESNLPLEEVGSISMRMNGWSVVLREGDVSTPHLHPRANISGVYYVMVADRDPDDAPGAGHLVLADPRIRASVAPIRNQATTVMVPPRAGMIVMFPSYLEHYVLPFKGEGKRISIAFNISFAPNALSQDQ